MFGTWSGKFVRWVTPNFNRFTSKSHGKLQRTPFFSHWSVSLLFKRKVPKVLWEKGTSRPRKELRSDPTSCPFVWAPSWKVRWRHHISSSGCGPDCWKKLSTIKCSQKVNKYLLQLTKISRGWLGIFIVSIQPRKCYCEWSSTLSLAHGKLWRLKLKRLQFTGRGLILGKIAIYFLLCPVISKHEFVNKSF